MILRDGFVCISLQLNIPCTREDALSLCRTFIVQLNANFYDANCQLKAPLMLEVIAKISSMFYPFKNFNWFQLGFDIL